VPASGSVFPLGTNLVTCTATNACRTNTCSFNLTVLLSPPPQLCPNPAAVVFSAGGTNDNFGGPQASFPSAGLRLRLNAAGIQNFKAFDECSTNTCFAHVLEPSVVHRVGHAGHRVRACGHRL
jgi:hypothetical protein